MTPAFKKLSILGSTGSIGRQCLSVVEALPDRFAVVALAAGSNIKLGGLLRLLHAVRDRLVPGSRFVTMRRRPTIWQQS